MKNSFSKIWNKFPAFLKNKYVLTIFAFFTYLLFFDSNDIPSQIRYHRILAKLNHQTEYCKKVIQEDRLEYAATFSTLEQMETYAREHYMMKKQNEDIFIIKTK